MKKSIYVGIGSSAGGLDALRELVSSLPDKKNYVYIIAQHLDPNKNSSLVDILSKSASLPVLQADENCKFSLNHIYIIPPNRNLVLEKSHLILEKPQKTLHIPTPSINTMFESLALFKKENCIGIVLTGAGSDGADGVKRIKELGGITIAQSPEQAYCSSMPQSAIDSNNIDYVLDIKQIAEYLSSNTLYGDITKTLASSIPLKSISEILHKEKNLDIKKYKIDTILRRISKRMLLVHHPTLDDYLQYLHNNPKEIELLYQDILIGVTEFFRDKKSFEVLKNKLTEYLKNKDENYEFRVWSIACSSGEEAYSLAILISEISKKLEKKFKVNIFATDIDERALSTARGAYYSQDSLKNIDIDILNKYFTPFNNGYKVIQAIREQIVFTHHNLLSDPPFINQDLISCRNLLIYILPEAQQEIFTLFHYALKDSAILFLGSSETTLLSIKYFSALNSEHKIYAKEKLSNPPRISNHYFSKHLEQKNENKPLDIEQTPSLAIEEQISNKVFDFFKEECILVDKNYSIVYKRGELPFLSLSDGFVTLNILENINKALRYDLQLLLENAFDTHKTETTNFIETAISSTEKIFIRVISHPFNDANNNSMLLLYFQKLTASDLQFNSDEFILPNESLMIESLSTQLNEVRKDNNSLLDKLTINKENMQLINEELQSSNEELQSSNEELETSNEELQSSNEELHVSILNVKKLQERFSLILNSTQDGMIGLDIDGNHIFTNNAATEMLGFSENELIGLNGHQIWHHTKKDGNNYPSIECALHNSLKKGLSLRSEDLFWKKDGTSFEVEVSQNPIIEDGEVIGSVLSFHDITEKNRLKRAAEHEHQLSDLYLSVPNTIVLTQDIDGNITMINKEGCLLLGFKHNEVIGKNFIDTFIPKKLIGQLRDIFKSVIDKKSGLVSHYKNIIIDSSNKEHLIAWTNSYLKDIDGNITGIISSGIDITNEEKLSKKLSEQENLYKSTFEEADIGIAHISLDGMWIDTNEYLTKLLGYTKEEFKKLSISDITYHEDKNIDDKILKQLLNNKKDSYHIEKRYLHKNGKIIWVNIGILLLRDELGNPIYFLKIIRDISELKLLVYQLELERNELKDIIEFTPIPIMLYSEDGEIIMINKVFRDTTGYSKDEITDIEFLIDNFYEDKQKKDAKEFFEKPFKSNTTQQTEQIFLSKSGEKKVGILNSIMLQNTHKDNKKIVLTAVVDITELQNKDEIMIAQSRQAAMGDMLAMIAHQWRQPLSVISMVSNNIRAQIALDEEVTLDDIKSSIDIFDEQTQYLSKTIDDFRNFFKPDKEKETISFNSLFSKIITLMQKSLENNNINLELPKNKDIEISTYPNQLIQVLINIINNAKDAISENNEGDGIIKITIDKKNNNIIINICDNGGGINPLVIDKLGQPYVSTKSKNGTGLGVYMSTIILSKHLNGKMYWENTKDGSCFHIQLPL